MTSPQFCPQAEQRRNTFEAARRAAGHTQAEAAELLGVARRTIENWEGGVSAIPAPALRLYLLLTDRDAEYRLERRCG